MNDTDRQELRDFLARELHGWSQRMTTLEDRLGTPSLWWHDRDRFRYLVGLSGECTDCGNPYYDVWAPDSPDSPASQLLGVIEAMREKGFAMRIDVYKTYYCAFFWQPDGQPWGEERADTLLDAVCLAARTAMEVKP